jgi:mRNA interferase RelE/StbE
MKWKVIMLPISEKQLAEIRARRIRESIGKRINDLEYEPELQGKPLIDELGGYRSVRAVSQRYRIIYKVEDERVMVLVVALGIRKDGDKKDVYNLAKKLIRLGLLELE